MNEIGLSSLMVALDEHLDINLGFNAKPITATELLEKLSKEKLSEVHKYKILRAYIPKYHKRDLKLWNYTEEYAEGLRRQGLEI